MTGDEYLPMLKPSCLADEALSKTKEDTPTCKGMSCAQDVSKDKLAQWYRKSHEMPGYANHNVKLMHTRQMPAGSWGHSCARYIRSMHVRRYARARHGLQPQGSLCEAQVLRTGHHNLHRR